MGQLHRALGLTSLIFYGVGVIVGAGIYSVIGAAAKEAGKGLWESFLIGAVPAVLAALCHAELASMFPRAGAAYIYLREAFPRPAWVSFATGFVLAIAGAATAATVALAFAGYLTMFFEGAPIWLAALGLLIACTVLNIAGIREAAWVTAICALIEVAGLVLIIGAGMFTADFGRGILVRPDAGVLSGAALIFFVYTGFEGVASLAEEAKRPEKDIPLALLISLGVTTLLYLMVAVAAVSLASPQELGSSDFPLATAAERTSPRLSTALGWIALFSTANTALITLVVISRLLFGMTAHGEMPAAFAWTHSKRKTPWVAALVIFAAACALLPLGGIKTVASLSSFATLLAFLGVSAALIALRYRRPQARRPFRVPLSIGRLPLLAVVGIVTVLGLMTQFEMTVYVAGGVVTAAGIGAYFLKWFWARPESAS